jgi:hypothetical protein
LAQGIGTGSPMGIESLGGSAGGIGSGGSLKRTSNAFCGQPHPFPSSRGLPFEGSGVALPFRSPHFVQRSFLDTVSIGVTRSRLWRAAKARIFDGGAAAGVASQHQPHVEVYQHGEVSLLSSVIFWGRVPVNRDAPPLSASASNLVRHMRNGSVEPFPW